MSQVDRRPDLFRKLEPGNFMDRLRDLERLVRRLEAVSGQAIDGVSGHSHSVGDLDLTDDSACPQAVDLSAATGSDSFLARRDHEHSLDVTVSPCWSGSHRFLVSPSMAGFSACGQRGQDIAWPTATSDAANKSYADTRLASRAVSGSAPTGSDVLAWDSSLSEWSPQAASRIAYPPAWLPEPNRPPTASNALDDEFDDGSLDGKWSTASSGSGVASPLEADDMLTISMPASNLDWALYQAAPTGSFIVTTRLAADRLHGDAQSAGLAVWSGSVGSSLFYRVALTARSGSGIELDVQQWSDWQWNADYYTSVHQMPQSLYARVRFDATASLLYLGWSGDGEGWREYRLSAIGSLANLGYFITSDGSPLYDWSAKTYWLRVES